MAFISWIEILHIFFAISICWDITHFLCYFNLLRFLWDFQRTPFSIPKKNQEWAYKIYKHHFGCVTDPPPTSIKKIRRSESKSMCAQWPYIWTPDNHRNTIISMDVETVSWLLSNVVKALNFSFCHKTLWWPPLICKV